MRGRNPAGPGENGLRASPEPSFGMTDSGGQGLPALPIHAQGESQGFRLTTPPPRLGPSFARPRHSAALPVPHPMRRPSGRVSNVFVRRVRLGKAGSPLPAERNDCETRANGTLSHALGRHTAAKGLAALPNEHAKGQPLRRTTPCTTRSAPPSPVGRAPTLSFSARWRILRATGRSAHGRSVGPTGPCGGSGACRSRPASTSSSNPPSRRSRRCRRRR